MMNAMVAALKALRDGALERAAKLAAKRADDAPTIVVAKGNNNIIPLPKRPGLLARIQHAGDHDDAPKAEPVSLPLGITSSLHTAHSIASEFDGDARFDDAATRQWRQDQTKQWRDSNRDLKRPQHDG
jgi:hypothetical protein